jgi:uncharacterized protein YegP (UPF0339 family)
MQYEIHRDNGGPFHWRLIGFDGAAVALSATTFASADDARHAAIDMHQHAAATGPDDSALRDGRPDALHTPVRRGRGQRRPGRPQRRVAARHRRHRPVADVVRHGGRGRARSSRLRRRARSPTRLPS